MADRQRIYSGSELEARYGYARAVVAGDRVVVSGTAPIWPDGSCDPDPGRAGAPLLRDHRDGSCRGRVVPRGGGAHPDVRHGRLICGGGRVRRTREFFASNPPATSMIVVAGLLDERWKVEIEAEAVKTSK